ncbi:MAG: copper chaperone PCu(A)C [Rudaea sp.]
MCRSSLFAIALMVATPAFGAGHLVVESGWIRTPPPGAMMLAGYATLHNVGDSAVVVTGAESADFGSVSLHQSVQKDGVEHMQALGDVSIKPGERITFAPNGRHFMLMQPKKELRSDESVPIQITTKLGDDVIGIFVVSDGPPKP